MPNLFEQFSKPKSVSISKPRKVVCYVNKPKWASELTDDEWNQYCYGDTETKHRLLTKLWQQDDLPF